MTKCDLLISGKIILSMDKELNVFNDSSIVVSDGKIVDIGLSDELIQKYQAAKIIKTGNSLIMPGFINTHTHAAMTYFRGLADDLELSVWLTEHIWPAEAKYVNDVFVKSATELACLEMIRAGVTTFNDMYFFADESAKVSKSIGMRCLLGETLVGFKTASCKNFEEALEKTQILYDIYSNDELVNISVNAHSIYACNEKCLKMAKDFSEKLNLPIHIHICETKKEINDAQKEFGLSPVEYLENLGLLNSKTIAAHAVWLSALDIEILKKRDVKICHNPVSNMKLASGLAPVAEMLSNGLIIGLGTDSAASNNTLDLFSEMRTASLIHKGFYLDSTALSAEEIVKMATINSAKVLGMDKEIGSLEIGKRADIVSINLDKPHLVPLFSPYSHLVYATNSGDVENVVINGKVIMENKEILTIDEKEVIKKAQSFSLSLDKKF